MYEMGADGRYHRPGQYRHDGKNQACEKGPPKNYADFHEASKAYGRKKTPRNPPFLYRWLKLPPSHKAFFQYAGTIRWQKYSNRELAPPSGQSGRCPPP